ncbi:transglycosylase domain-containing protein [Benzoatithermus flavus]|uniref:peptidoglycan glycosyltransferase n=1 Tax=Benzoatithermus flavus TaxID=3108223 RepID=A0ABU8XMI5_9PROT
MTRSPRRPAPPPPPPRRGLLRRLLGLVPALLLLGLVGWAALFFTMAPSLPDTRELFQESRQAKVTVLAANGQVIAVRGSDGQRFVQLDEISPWLVKAVIATEDSRFYHHFGIDPIGLARALVKNLLAGDVVAGGSTITQQLAKNLYLTPERSLKRKLQELTLAIWLETRLGKDDILTLYLNRVYLGAGAYGVEAAAQRYFGKPAKNLTLAESAMIAGLLRAPSALAPTNDLDRARDRASIVLVRMQDEGFITAEQATAARMKPAKLAPEAGEMAGYFVDWVLDGLTRHLGKPEHDLFVYTTLDPKLQAAAESALGKVLARAGERNAVAQGAVVLLDRTGAVRAMVGGRSHLESPFNRAVNAHRQPGSAFKPFVYLTALEAGWQPGNTIDDRPFRLGDWQPANFDGKYRGRITLTEAFAHSVNTTAVRLAQTVGPAVVVKKARQLGVVSELQAVPSIALGTSEVTLLELTGAYLPFATGGLRRPLYGVTTVEEDSGRALYRHVPTEARVISPAVADAMQAMMAAVIETGTGRAARLGDRVAAGKTGTTQNGRDAWFVGFSGDYVAGVWLGNDDNTPMKGVLGSNLPAQIWREVMLATPKPSRPEPQPVPVAKREESGFDWLMNLIDGVVGRATN